MNPTITAVRVGRGDHGRIFHISRRRLAAESGYFSEILRPSGHTFTDTAAAGDGSDNDRPCNDVAEHSSAESVVAELPDEDPVLFQLFVVWLNHRPEPLEFKHDCEPSEEPWLSRGAEAWSLAVRLRAPAFERYALSQVARNCARAPYGPWKYIEQHAAARSSLHRFGDHWVAWNVRQLAADVGGPAHQHPAEYDGLLAALRATEVADDTRDPRIYDLDHWFTDCGDSFDPGCPHDPVACEEHRNAVAKAELAKLTIRERESPSTTVQGPSITPEPSMTSPTRSRAVPEPNMAGERISATPSTPPPQYRELRFPPSSSPVLTPQGGLSQGGASAPHGSSSLQRAAHEAASPGNTLRFPTPSLASLQSAETLANTGLDLEHQAYEPAPAGSTLSASSHPTVRPQLSEFSKRARSVRLSLRALKTGLRQRDKRSWVVGPSLAQPYRKAGCLTLARP